MENTTLILIVITNLLLILILGVFGFFIYRLIKDQKKEKAVESSAPPINSEFHPAIVERLKEVQKIKARRAELFCPNHPEEPGEVTCGICDKIFCQSCIKPFKSLHFCREHLPLVMNHQWEEVMTVKTSTQDPEHGVRVYDLKKEIFEKEELPTYVETHYKINVDHDLIETYLVVFAMQEQMEKIKAKFATTSL